MKRARNKEDSDEHDSESGEAPKEKKSKKVSIFCRGEVAFSDPTPCIDFNAILE